VLAALFLDAVERRRQLGEGPVVDDRTTEDGQVRYIAVLDGRDVAASRSRQPALPDGSGR